MTARPELRALQVFEDLADAVESRLEVVVGQTEAYPQILVEPEVVAGDDQNALLGSDSLEELG